MSKEIRLREPGRFFAGGAAASEARALLDEVRGLREEISRPRELYPSDHNPVSGPAGGNIDGQGNVSRGHQFQEKLRKRGYSEDQIRQIAGDATDVYGEAARAQEAYNALGYTREYVEDMNALTEVFFGRNASKEAQAVMGLGRARLRELGADQDLNRSTRW